MTLTQKAINEAAMELIVIWTDRIPTNTGDAEYINGVTKGITMMAQELIKMMEGDGDGIHGNNG